jgi:hypothetical protein
MTDLENVASQKVLEKIGFAQRGIETFNGDETLVYLAKILSISNEKIHQFCFSRTFLRVQSAGERTGDLVNQFTRRMVKRRRARRFDNRCGRDYARAEALGSFQNRTAIRLVERD